MDWTHRHSEAFWLWPRSVSDSKVWTVAGLTNGPPIYFGAVRLITRSLVWLLGLLVAAISLSGCGIGGLSPIFPTPVSPNGQNIYDTYIGISVPALIIFIGVEAALLWIVVKYRRSRQPAGYVPPQTHGNTPLEIVWTIAPLVVVLAIALYSFVELQRDFQPVNNAAFTVVVSGHQFGWNYAYPQGFTVHQEGTLQGEVAPFVVPTNTLIKLQFQGTDVIHSWWVPAISGKTDAVPGYDNFSWLKIDRTGKWKGECAELCGVGHATMQIVVQAMSQSDYDQWVQEQLATKKGAAASPSS